MNTLPRRIAVSTLVLMDSWIKTCIRWWHCGAPHAVSTLVLMDSWIKTASKSNPFIALLSFNPCFNGFMDKDLERELVLGDYIKSFNPCFNGFMDKDRSQLQ